MPPFYPTARRPPRPATTAGLHGRPPRPATTAGSHGWPRRSPPAANMDGMADERAVVEELIAAINAHDRQTACNLFVAEGRMVTAGGRTLDVGGIDELLRHTMEAFPDLAVTVRRWVVDHDV